MLPNPRNLNVFYFLIYAMIGWSFELVYCFFIDGEFINRGFLHGPYLPIYGFGAILIINLVAPYCKNSKSVLFLASFLLCTVLEYFTSWYMETTFHVSLWSYGNYPLNINGRVCLWNSLLFGGLALVVIYVFQPFFNQFLKKIPEEKCPLISIAIVAGLVIDFLFVAIPMLNQASTRTEILILFS